MKRIIIFFVLLTTLSITAGAQALDDGTLVRDLYAVILVISPEEAAKEAVEWTENLDGYFLMKSSDMLVLRFPTDRTGDFRNFLEDLSEDVIDFSIESHDVSDEILSLESGIRAREEILQRNLAFIDSADVKGTLAIENEVMRLLREIESMKGRLNRLRTDVRMARAEVSFRFRDESLPSDIPSSFDWINRVDFYRFLKEASR